MQKAADAFRTISEVAEDLDLPQHVLRFWETRFSQIKPMKRGGGRRYYRPEDISLLRGIQHLLYSEGYTIKGVQRILKEQGVRFVAESPDAPPGSFDDEDATMPAMERKMPPEPVKEAAPPVKKAASEASSARQSDADKTLERDKAIASNHNKSDIDALAASYGTPDGLVGARLPADRDKRVAAPVRNEGAAPPFAITHSVPNHLVAAIVSGVSMVETVPLPDEAEDIPLPSDILPDSDSDDAGKVRGRGLLDRFKAGGANHTGQKNPSHTQLPPEDVQRLQATLVDLLECKRLLDQIR